MLTASSRLRTSWFARRSHACVRRFGTNGPFLWDGSLKVRDVAFITGNIKEMVGRNAAR